MDEPVTVCAAIKLIKLFKIIKNIFYFNETKNENFFSEWESANITLTLKQRVWKKPKEVWKFN